MKKWLVGLVCVGMWAGAALGAQSIAEGTDVTQDFDSIGASATATLPADWKTDKQLTARTVGTFAAAVTATERVDGQNVSSTAGNGIYNLGAPTDDATDRAIGWLSSSSATKSGNLYLEMVNSGATAITNLFISYNVEKYRNGSNAAGFQIQLYYSTDGATWTSAGATFLTAFPADADSLGFDVPPGATVAVSGSLDLTAAPIATSANVYLAWNYSVQSGTTTSSAQLLGVDDVLIALAGVSTPSVSFSAAVAAVDENVGTYALTVNKNMASGDVSGEIALSGTASEGAGADYTVDTTNFTLNGETTTATITVTVNDDADPEPSETVVLTLANVVGANLLVPSVFTLTINPNDAPSHAIAIVTNAPENGTVTTTPAGSAEEGQTVTVNATPADGYRVASIAVVDGGSNPVTVTGNTFVMPTSDAAVTVSFEVYEAPDQLIDFETVTGFNSYAPGTSTVSGVLMAHSGALRGTSASDPKNGAASARIRYLSTNVGFIATAEALAQPITKINFLYADYGSDNTTTFKVQVSADGASWQDVGAAAYDPDGATLLEGTIDSIPANMTYFQFLALGGEADRVCIDDVGLWFGAASFGVTFDQPEGFQIEQGTGDVITATAANGTEPYGYAWSSSLDGAYYSALDNVFTILATAPVGDYSAQMIATDATAAAVTNTINFSVTAPVVKYGIAIVTNAPENGTVTTTPATEAAEGATVTVSATPVGGYAVQSIAVVDEAMNPVTVTGNAFTMPASAVTVTVTFQEAATSGALIISQYYEGASNNKWIEIYNPGTGTIDLPGGSYRLGQWNGTNREGWKMGYPPSSSIALSNSIAGGATFLVMNNASVLPAYAVADQMGGTTVMAFNGDDSMVLYTGTTFEFANVVDAVGLTGNTAVDTSYVRKDTVTAGVNTDFNAADWDVFTLTQVEDALAGTNERLGYHSTGAPVFGVNFDKSEGFEVEEGTATILTATAANGTAPYVYGWDTDMAPGDYLVDSNSFGISGLAAVGSYYATVTATDSSDPVQVVSNTIHFSVVAPAPKYAISIVTNASANGTVTTTPATEAEAGQTVTVTAIPAGGYAVESIVVNGGAVTVTGNAFTMPAEPATVTVTFMEYTAPDVLIDFEDYTGSYAWNEYAAGGVTWTMTNVFAGNTVDDAKNGTKAGRFENNRGGVGNPATMTSTAFTAAVTKITFWYANYGVNDGGAFKVQVSDDGSTWTDVGAAEYNPDSKTLTLGTIDSIPAGMTHVKFITTAGSAQRVNVDDIGIFFGAPVLGVSVDKANGFTVEQGQSDAITATAVNGTAPYGYSWTSTLGEGYRTAVDNVFTILATAPAGDYTATVTATDSAMQTASNTVSFTVLGGGGEIWQIGDGSQDGAMFYTTSNQTIMIVLPTNYTLNAVYGTDSSSVGLNNLGQGMGSPLTQGVDYNWNPATRTISVLSGVTNRRVLRIGASPE